MKLKGREAVRPLGSHTAVGFLHELKRWKDIPYLDKNEGMLPPFMIAVGSRVRVMKAREALGLQHPVLIDQETLEKVGLNAWGRVNMLLGVHENDGHPFPLLILETQMGCPATQIILKEALYYTNDKGYNIPFGKRGRAEVKSDGIFMVRAGTCAGVNSFSKAEFITRIGDILIANESYGSIGAVIQSIVKELNFVGIKVADRVDALREVLSEFRTLDLSHDEANLRTVSSPLMTLNLQRAAQDLGFTPSVGANFSKDSLYSEMGEDEFAWLRDNYGVISTEMEQVVIDTLAALYRRADTKAYSGLVSAAIGAIPGKSFPETAEEKMDAENAEGNALRVAAKALGNIAKSFNR
jgi:uridine phosphorylase